MGSIGWSIFRTTVGAFFPILRIASCEWRGGVRVLDQPFARRHSLFVLPT
jgi:hypothetical protein